MLANFIALLFLSALAVARRTCKVSAIGGGEDDGPAINAAFERCSKNAKVVLDKYYVVDTLLLTKDLDDVEVELSGTGEQHQRYLHRPVCNGRTQSSIHRTSPNGLLRACFSHIRTRMFDSLV